MHDLAVRKRRRAAQKERVAYIAPTPPISHAGHQTGYASRFDSHYCLTCNVWTETGCSDADCCYCNSRPNTPQEAAAAQLLNNGD